MTADVPAMERREPLTMSDMAMAHDMGRMAPHGADTRATAVHAGHTTPDRR